MIAQPSLTPCLPAGDELAVMIRRVCGEVPEQGVMSCSRWIDGLLDIYNVATDAGARGLIEAALQDVRFRNAVRVVDVRRTLQAIADATPRG